MSTDSQTYDQLGGWIPYPDRTHDQQLMSDEWRESTPMFSTINSGLTELPSEALGFKLWLAIGQRPLRVYQQIGSCLPGHALVRMADGSERPIKDITPGDEVITHVGVSRRVLGVQRKKTSEQMRQIRVRGWSDRLLCTDGHLLPSWDGNGIEWLRAEDVTDEHYLLTGYSTTVGEDQVIDVLEWLDGYDFSEITKAEHRQNKSDVSRTHRRTSALIEAIESRGLEATSSVCVKNGRYSLAIPRRLPVTTLFARWFGLYLAEGCCEPARVTFTLSRTEESLALEVMQLTRAIFGLEATIQTCESRPGSMQVRIGSKTLASFVSAFAPGKAKTKRVPGLFFRCREEIQKALVGGWFDGDGYAKQHRRGFRLTGVSASTGLARDMATLASSCGIKASTRRRAPRGHSAEAAEFSMLPEQARDIPSTKLESIPVACGLKRSLLMTRYGVARRVVSNEAIGVPTEDVYDIHVDIDNTFIAWGFVVHNCVGAGGAVAYGDAMAGDVVNRGSQEAVEIPNWMPTWGMGRQMGGMRGRGEGSFGGAQAESVEKWGYVPIGTPGLPQPKQDGDWLVWTKDDEYNYSWPPSFPTAEATLRPEANKYRIGKQVQVSGLEELDNALAQGYGVTMASNYGSKTMKVRDGFLIATWDGSWAHQMTVDGYIIVPGLGKLYLIKNQWGRRAHPTCPYLAQYGVEGAFWMPEADMLRNIGKQYTEVIIHTSTGDFPLRKLPFDNFGIAT